MSNRAEEHLRRRFAATLLTTRQQERRIYQSPYSAQPDTLVASYNVHKCVGTDKRFDPDRVAAVIGEIGADILALQEASRRFGDRAVLLDLAGLERSCGLVAAPLTGSSNGPGWHGNLLLVREASIREVHPIRLPGVEPRGALVVDLDLTAGPLRIVAAHLGLLRRSRAQQADAILKAVSARTDRPTILLGDLNEWRQGNRSALRTLAPAFGPLSAALPSFPSPFPVLALDRILGKPHSLISRFEVHETPLARTASDHLPVKAWIALESVSARTQEATETMAA